MKLQEKLNKERGKRLLQTFGFQGEAEAAQLTAEHVCGSGRCITELQKEVINIWLSFGYI